MPPPSAHQHHKPRRGGEPSWSFRRLIVLPLLVWAAWEVHGILVDPMTGQDTKAMLGRYLLYLICFLGAVYSGLATTQDAIAIWRTGTGRPYADPAVAIADDAQPAPTTDQDPGDRPLPPRR